MKYKIIRMSEFGETGYLVGPYRMKDLRTVKPLMISDNEIEYNVEYNHSEAKALIAEWPYRSIAIDDLRTMSWENANKSIQAMLPICKEVYTALKLARSLYII
jgi:hypothetical protein